MALSPAQLKAAGPHTLFPLPDRTAFWAAAKDQSRVFDTKTLGRAVGAVLRTKTKLKEAWQYFRIESATKFVRVQESDFIAYIEKSAPPKVTAKVETKPEPKKDEPKAKVAKEAKKDEPKKSLVERGVAAAKKLVKKPGVDSTKYSYTVQDGLDIGAATIDAIEKLVRGSGVKAPSDIGTRLRGAKLLVAAKDKADKVVGRLGLQLKAKDYVDSLNLKAKAKLGKDALELAWIRVDTSVPTEDKDTVVKAMFESLKLGKSTRPVIADSDVYAVYNVSDTIGNGYMTLLKLKKHDRTHPGLVKEAQLYTL